MKPKRPDPTASTESWISIWLGCIDVKFTRSSGNAECRHVDKRNTKYTNHPHKRLGTSLHQNFAGHGYQPLDACKFHPYHHFEGLGGTPIGGSPRELTTFAQAWRMKHRF